MKYLTYASALVSIAAATALAGNDRTTSSELAQEVLNAGSPSPAPLPQVTGDDSGPVRFPAGIRWNAAPQTPVSSSIRVPSLGNHAPEGNMNRRPNDYSDILSGMTPPKSPSPADENSGNTVGNSPVTVPLPSGVTMGLLGIATAAIVARRRAARCKSV